jgi:carbon monoxide dehydrogenase subunit G
MIAFFLLTNTEWISAQNDAYNLDINVQEIEERKFSTHASFKLPLTQCQAWKALIDYEASAAIPGVISSKSNRISGNRTQVKLVMEETILLFNIRMDSVLDFVETKNQGTHFVQIAGLAKSFTGSWRIEPKDNGTVFRYESVFQPDSALPMVVMKYFFDKRLRETFAAMAHIGSAQKNTVCD